ncbi:hypothetical protein PInf_012544 [Phytophthora infestans]|nr:hypothetical protein PInf_012544 [Phytophthora infestans]
MDVFLVEAMTDQAKAGKRADSGFKKEAWVAVHESMNERFNKELTIQQIKTRVQTLKSKYTTISHMLRVSGFGWDTSHNVVLVHDDVWDRYVSGHTLLESTHSVLTSQSISTQIQTFLRGFKFSSRSSDASKRGNSHISYVNRSGRPEGRQQNDSQQKGSRKRNRDSGGALIADAINEVATETRNRTARMKTLTSSQKAIKVLQKTYAERFSAFEMAQAFDVMLDENKARLFVVMEEGEVRDIWLANQVSSSD